VPVEAAAVTGSLGRLAGAALALAIGVAVLWQAGILFTSDDTGDLDLAPADTSLQTPAVEGFDVGLSPGDVAPDFAFSSFEGERLSLSDFRGRPVLINFWATWCQPCRAEMPAIDEAVRRYASDNVAVLAINRGERFGPADEWADELGVVFTAFGYDPEESVYDRYEARGMPTSFFIDAQGVITEVVVGPLRESDLDFSLQKTIAGYQPGD
jgi:thiol-disulfide isomerase/thioredoxin